MNVPLRSGLLRLRGVLLLFVLAVAVSGCITEPSITPASVCGGPSVPSAHPRAATYQAVLDHYVRRGLPGVAVSIRDENGLWTGTAGKADIARGVPLETCHLMKVASVTKMHMAALTMLLVEEGTLRLDDPITRWLPAAVTGRLPNAERITLFHLLAHQTGLHDVVTDEQFYLAAINHPTRAWTQLDLLRFVYGKPAAFRPGMGVSYSNTNTLLLSLVIESATQRSHATLLRERIFRPLGMRDTFYQGDGPLPQARVAQGYFDIYRTGTISNLSNYNFGGGNGYGGMLSTVEDLQRFITALFVDRTLLTPRSLDRMMQFSPMDPLIGVGIVADFWGYGVETLSYGHSGGDLAYTSDLYWFRETGATVAMMTNLGAGLQSRREQSGVIRDFRRDLAERIVRR